MTTCQNLFKVIIHSSYRVMNKSLFLAIIHAPLDKSFSKGSFSSGMGPKKGLNHHNHRTRKEFGISEQCKVPLMLERVCETAFALLQIETQGFLLILFCWFSLFLLCTFTPICRIFRCTVSTVSAFLVAPLGPTENDTDVNTDV